MTDYYVDSNATGLNNGTSFTNAYTSLSSITPAAGDRVLIANNHSESYPGSSNTSVPPVYTVDPDRLVPVLSVDTTNENLSRGAAITRGQSSRLTDGYAWYGVDFDSSAGDQWQNVATPTSRAIFRDCSFTKTGSGSVFSAAGFYYWEFYDCTITNNGTGGWWDADNSGYLKMRNCIVDGTATTVFFTYNFDQGYHVHLDFENCDFSGASATGNLLELTADVRIRGRIVNCRLPTSMIVLDRTDTDSAYVQDLEVILTDNATSADPNVAIERHTSFGVTTTDEVRVRTGGASDGTTDFSWRMDADAASVPIPGVVGLITPPISVFVDGGSATTITINVAHDGVGDGTAGDLTDQELWIEGYTPDTNSPGGPAKGAFTTAGTGTPTDLGNNSETWGGTGVGTKQEVSHTFTPTEDGYVSFQVHFAPVDATGVAVNVDPKPVVS